LNLFKRPYGAWKQQQKERRGAWFLVPTGLHPWLENNTPPPGLPENLATPLDIDYCFFAVPSGLYYRHPQSGAGAGMNRLTNLATFSFPSPDDTPQPSPPQGETRPETEKPPTEIVSPEFPWLRLHQERLSAGCPKSLIPEEGCGTRLFMLICAMLLGSALMPQAGCERSPPTAPEHLDEMIAETGVIFSTLTTPCTFASPVKIKRGVPKEYCIRLITQYLNGDPGAIQPRYRTHGTLRARDFWALVLANLTGKRLEIFPLDKPETRDAEIEALLDALQQNGAADILHERKTGEGR